MEDPLKISICTTHLALAVVVNFAIAAMIGILIHYAWILHHAQTLGFTVLLFITICTLSLYFWVKILSYLLRPIKLLIDTLYRTVRDKPSALEDIAQNSTEIAKISYVLKVLQDNTRQIGAVAKELKEEKEYLQTILETIPDAIVTIDSHGMIQMINSATEKAFGYDRSDLIGQKVDVLLTQADRERYRSKIDQYLQEGCSPLLREMHEMEARRKDGSTFPMEIWISSLQYNNYPVCLGVIRDIGLRKKVEAEHAHYLQELESSNRELDDFAYIVSHDLKEPLRGLQTFSNILLEDYEGNLDEDGKNKLRTIGDLTKNMATLLDTLLYYSRVGKTALAIHETDLDEVVRKVADSFSIDLKEKNVTIEIPQKLPLMVCDHVRIAEVFQNLIGNALKYNDRQENKIEIGTIENHPRAPGQTVFYVRDQGIGIPERHLETVFKIFKRLHPRNAYGGGTGSGLAIVKRIITQHGGEIWVESKGEGQGTTFFFTLPQPKKE